MPLLIDLFPCRADNIGYLVHDVGSGRTATIDAPEFKPIKAALDHRGWRLTDVFITHHHTDHVEAIPALKREYGATVTGPASEANKILGLDRRIEPGEVVELGDARFEVLHTPGHTNGHIVYFDPDGRHLFSADALFSLGVGRMFEGRADTMWAGLDALRQLPDETLIYCGHEYTADNARFAQSIDPRNSALALRAKNVARLREQGEFTVPVSLRMEKATNPFLRADSPAMARAMGFEPGADPAQVFGALRKAKDEFKG